MNLFSTNYNETYPMSGIAPQFSLAATTALSYTVPGDSSKQYQAWFSFPYNANIWLGVNTTPTVPTLGVMSSNTQCELNPNKIYVRGGDVLSFISGSIVTDAGFRLTLLGS